MFSITTYTVEQIKDPFGILSGKRYEWMLEIEVEEEDELYSENGLQLRVIYQVEDEQSKIVNYEFLESGTNRYLDFELEDEEKAFVEAFCKEHDTEEQA